MRDINSLNKVLLIGNLGQKPDVRYLPQGRALARFSLATKERFTNPNSNQTQDRTEWHRIVVWGKLAEFCEKYLTQGKQVYIEGKLRTRPWQDKEGVSRKTTEIEAQTIIFLGKREGAPEEESFRTGTAVTDFPADTAGPDIPSEGEGEDEIPF
ncbi:MAG: single-stranded DNA-binding protein [Candidatus Aminicenantes bacterium]|nr:single-stranded DNA-binding protein [Candidatus Aminicenantes bacterium]